MSFESFKQRVTALAKKSGISEPVRFFRNTDKGQYIAKCCDVTIIGNSSSFRVKICWGSGHAAAVSI